MRAGASQNGLGPPGLQMPSPSPSPTEDASQRPKSRAGMPMLFTEHAVLSTSATSCAQAPAVSVGDNMYPSLDGLRSEEESKMRLYARRNGRLMLADSKRDALQGHTPVYLSPLPTAHGPLPLLSEMGPLSFGQHTHTHTHQARDPKHARTYSFSPRLCFSLFSTASRYPVVVT